jgi:TolB-like protein
MADALITRLGTLQALRVPPTAALRHDEDPFDAGARLRVDAVLSGTLQRSRDRLRVTAQLSRLSDRTQIWAGVFDEDLTDIFAVQDSIAERIAASVQQDLTARQLAGLHRRETANFAASISASRIISTAN